jgi:transcriptional regulator with XRE-family HTH domain
MTTHDDNAMATFGKTLRTIRMALGLTQDQVVARVSYSKSWLSSVENGQQIPLRKAVIALEQALGTDSLVELYDRLANSTLPGWIRDWVEEERKSKILRSFELAVIYGLLQTPEYASALLADDEAAIQVRKDRQALLSGEDPPTIHCVMDESVLRREIGDAKIMRGQLEHLIALMSDKVSIQIIPSRRHPGVRGSFALATLDDESEVAYLETTARGFVTTNKEDVDHVSAAWETIRSNALPVDMSRDLILKIMEEEWT